MWPEILAEGGRAATAGSEALAETLQKPSIRGRLFREAEKRCHGSSNSFSRRVGSKVGFLDFAKSQCIFDHISCSRACASTWHQLLSAWKTYLPYNEAFSSTI